MMSGLVQNSRVAPEWLSRLKTEHQVQDGCGEMNVATDPHEGNGGSPPFWVQHSGGGTFFGPNMLRKISFEKSYHIFFLANTVVSIHHPLFLLNWSTTISIHLKPAPVLVNFHIAFRWITMLLLKLIQFLDEKGPMFSSPNISVCFLARTWASATFHYEAAASVASATAGMVGWGVSPWRSENI